MFRLYYHLGWVLVKITLSSLFCAPFPWQILKALLSKNLVVTKLSSVLISFVGKLFVLRTGVYGKGALSRWLYGVMVKASNIKVNSQIGSYCLKETSQYCQSAIQCHSWLSNVTSLFFRVIYNFQCPHCEGSQAARKSITNVLSMAKMA